jgi:hypothetical protein
VSGLGSDAPKWSVGVPMAQKGHSRHYRPAVRSLHLVAQRFSPLAQGFRSPSARFLDSQSLGPGSQQELLEFKHEPARGLIVLVHVEVTLAPPHESKDAALVLPRETEKD